MRRHILAALALSGIALTGTLAPQEAAAGTGLMYQAVDADNDPYSGIYLRDGTSMNNVRRIADRYMVYGTRVELICGQDGEAVGPFQNRRWHQVRVASGNTTGQIGWIADRYLNTPNKANQATPGEPECTKPAPQVPAAPTGVYLSPFESSDASHGFQYSSNTKYLGPSSWQRASKSCDTQYVYDAIKKAAGDRPIQWLASWSISKITPMYYMARATDAELKKLNYVLMIDPGPNQDFPSCMNGTGTQFDAGSALARWLKINPNAKLVIIAGKMTDTSRSGRIQNDLFNDVRNASSGTDIRARVGVCWYKSLAHNPDSYQWSEWYIERPIAPSGACPGLGPKRMASSTPMWHP